jgi:acyl-CoA thioester hydrolase
MDQWHTMPVRVYFEDTDAQGVVYFANYLKFMERGRTEWLRACGIEQDALMAAHGLGFTVVDTQLQFRRPARFNDTVLVRTRLLEKRGVRFRLEQAVVRAKDEAVLCEGWCVAACIDLTTFKPRRIPAEIGLPDVYDLEPGASEALE